MKKSNYLLIGLIVFLSFGCSKEEAPFETLNSEELVTDVEQNSSLEVKSLDLKNSKKSEAVAASFNLATQSKNLGPTDTIGDGSTGNDPGDENPTTSNNIQPWDILVEYPTGFSQSQKEIVRNSYNDYGELLFYNQCFISPNKEVWKYKIFPSANSLVHTNTPINTGLSNPDPGEPGGLVMAPPHLIFAEIFPQDGPIQFSLDGECN